MARLTLFTRRVVVIIWGGVFFLRGGEGCGEDGMGWDGSRCFVKCLSVVCLAPREMYVCVKRQVVV